LEAKDNKYLQIQIDKLKRKTDYMIGIAIASVFFVLGLLFSVLALWRGL